MELKNFGGFVIMILLISVCVIAYKYVDTSIFLKEPDIGYLNKSLSVISIDRQPQISFVSATEYISGDRKGATIIKLEDYKGNKINTTCRESILYPNKTTYIGWSLMSYMSSYGNYYLDFTVPISPIGEYDQEVRCFVNNKNISIGKGFHLGNTSAIVQKIIQDNVPHIDIMSSVT
jgi:hypothetical protein